MYFKKFPNAIYDFTIKTDAVPYRDIICDLTTRVNTYIKSDDMDDLCDIHMIQNDELPEHIAFKLYGDPLLHWTILYINGICDMCSQWPLSEAKLKTYAMEKYGTNINSVKHTVKLPENIVMDRVAIEAMYGPSYAADVTNWEYEIQQNEYKRFVKVIKAEFIGNFVDEYFKSLV